MDKTKRAILFTFAMVGAATLLFGIVSFFKFCVLGGKDEPTYYRKACPAMARVCPDGTAVEATGPNCEYICPPVAREGDTDSSGGSPVDKIPVPL